MILRVRSLVFCDSCVLMAIYYVLTCDDVPIILVGYPPDFLLVKRHLVPL